jgi:hypothetical protein
MSLKILIKEKTGKSIVEIPITIKRVKNKISLTHFV